MSNKNGRLESNSVIGNEKEVYTLKDEKPSNSEGLRFVYLVDLKGKRRLKKSTPTIILNKIEALGTASEKALENALASSPTKALKANFDKALAVRIAKGNSPITLREFVRARIKGVIRYYTASDVIEDVFNELNPIVRTVNEKGVSEYTLTGKYFPVSK